MFTTSPAGYELIKRFEGCEKRLPDNRLTTYKIGNDPETIGWGQTGKMPDGRPVVMGLIITQQEADDALQYFVRSVVEPIVREHFVCQTQSEFDACVSWVYNVRHERIGIPVKQGGYSLPNLITQKDRGPEAITAIVHKWMEYVKTPGFENGLTKRRIAEILMFLGLPWSVPSVWGYIANARYKTKDGVIDPTDPWFIIEMAEAAKPIATLPDPPKAPKPIVPVETKPLPEIAKAPEPKTATVKKPPSPNTKTPAQVGLDPNAGLKHVSESQRARGWMYQQFGLMLLRLSTLGMFGNGAAVVANTLQADATLMTAAFELAIPLAINGGTLAPSYVLYWWGQFQTIQGRQKGSQPLYV